MYSLCSSLTHEKARNVESALRVGTLFRNAKHPITRIYELCGQPAVHVLGSVNNPAQADPYQINATTSPNSRVPQISSAKARTIQIIMFSRPLPHRMQYISLSPISLALGDKAEQVQHPSGSMEAEDERLEAKNRARLNALVEKLKYHTVTKHPPTPKELALPRIVNQINCSWELHELLQKNIALVGTRQRRSLSVSERVVESASSMRDFVVMAMWQLMTVYIYPVIRRTFVVGLLCHRVVAEMLLLVLEWRGRSDHAALKDISATAQQVEIRLQQFCYWPMQYVTLRKRKNDWESVTTSHPDYIRFYNSLWLVANDVIIGIALGSYIIDNADWVAESISSVLSTYTVAALQRTISWLMFWPAGLKLNGELARFLGDLFLWVIDYWSSTSNFFFFFITKLIYSNPGCIEALEPVLPHVIWFIGFSSFAGASMPIALFSDMLSVLTLHIYSFYMASARIFHWQLTIIISLFHLFRGKKHNVLRKRIDSCDYDLDQLLLGTILFTLLFFLLPTVVVFYLAFASARMAIISLKAVLDTALACLNHFPLFALMLRLKDSQRLPGRSLIEICWSRLNQRSGGIRFELQDTQTITSNSSDSSTPPTSYIYLKVAIFYKVPISSY